MHPTHEELIGLVHGTLDEQSADSVAGHIEECAECEETVRELDTAVDEVIQQLRTPATPGRFEAEPGCRDLVSIVAAIGRDLSVEPTAATMQQDAEPELGVIRDYQLLSQIGEGGMGAVYKALHTRLQKVVALKVLPAGRMNDPQAVQRFEREMQAVGRLSHPNIVGAHDAGEHEGTHFLVMEHVDGLDLSGLIRNLGPLPIADACELARQAAVGLQHAHEHDLVHRDIKPSNLMLGPDGQVKILDLGLARLHIRDQAELTSTGQMMGTLDYIAPEQTGDSHDVDIRADIFSLGATLYKLLTGVTPYSDPRYNTAVKRLAALANDPIPPVQERREDVPAELAAVVSRMLAKDPDERFGTPAEVAQALEQFAVGAEPAALLAHAQQSTPEEDASVSVENSTAPHLSSFTDTDSYRNDPSNIPSEAFDNDSKQAARELESTVIESAAGTSRATRTSRRTIVTCVLAGLGILLSGVIVFRLNLPAGTIILECDPAALAGAKIEINGEEVTIKLTGDNQLVTIGVDARRGELRITKADFKVFTKAFEIAVGEDEHSIQVRFEPLLAVIPDPAPPQWQLGPAEDVLPGLVPRPTKLPGVKRWQVETTAPRGSVSSVDWSPDGRFVAAGGGGAVRIYEADTLQLVHLLTGHNGYIKSVAWSPDGKTLASASTDKTVRLWKADGTQGPVLNGHTNVVEAVSWRPDGKQLASCSGTTIRIWSPDGEEIETLYAGQGGVRCLAWSRDGKQLATGFGNGTIRLWSTDGTLEQTLEGHTGRVLSVAWSPDRTTLASGSIDKTIRLWNADGTVGTVLAGHTQQVVCLAWSHDGEFLASHGDDTTIRLWKADGTAVSFWECESYGHSLAWSPDGERIVAGYVDTTVRVWNTDGTAGPAVSTSHDVLTAVAWSPDSQQLAAGHFGGVELLAVDGTPEAMLQGPGGSCLAWHPDGSALASADGSNAWVLNLDGTKRSAIAAGHGLFVAWRPDGEQLAWSEHDVGTHLSAPDGKPGPVLKEFGTIAWSPDGKRLVTDGRGSAAQIWQADGTPGPKLQVDFGAEFVHAVAWSPDGGMIATGAGSETDGPIRLWNADGTPGPVLEGHTNRIGTDSLAWNPDGSQLASGSYDRTVRLWNRDGSAGPVLVGDSSRIHSLSWSRDGKRLASGTEENTILVRNAETGEPEWMAVFLPENKKAVFGGGGKLLHGDPDVVEKELAYVIEDSTGGRHLLQPSEFNDFVDSGQPFDLWRNSPSPDDNRWTLGPAEDVLPGLVPRPTKLPGVKRWQVETAAPRGYVWSVDWSPDGRFVACGSTDGAMRIYEAEQLKLVRLLAGHHAAVFSVAWSPDGSMFASGSADRTIRLWNTDGTPGPVFRGHTSDVYAVTWSPDGKQLASAGLDHTIRIFDSNGTEKHVFDIPSAGGLRTVAWSPDGKRLAFGHGDNTIRLLSLDGEAEVILKGHSAGMTSIVWSPDGKTLASGSSDKTIRLWNADGTSRLVLEGHEAQVTCIAWSQDGEFLASGSDDQTIRVWKADGTAVSTWQQDTVPYSLGWSPDGKRVVAGYGDTRIRVWNRDGAPVLGVSDSRIGLTTVDWSPGGRQLAAGYGGGSGEVQLWNTDGEPAEALPGPGGNCLAWSPDGAAVASAAGSELWLLHLDGTKSRRIQGGIGSIDSVAWNSDGKQFAWANVDRNTVRLAAPDGTRGPIFEGAFSVAWSPDGQRLVTGSNDYTPRIWRGDGTPGPELKGHTGNSVYAVAWSPDGGMIATGDNKALIHLWNPDGTPISVFKEAAARRGVS